VLKPLQLVDGLQQAACDWHNTLKLFLLDAGFVVSRAGNVMFARGDAGANASLVLG
jgi:hypothetical protein